MITLKNTTALVTGGGQGIGRGIAHQLAKAGADIIIAQRNQDTAKKVVSEIESMGRRAFALHIDVANSRSVNSCIKKALKLVPEINILVNNAGTLQKNIGDKTSCQDFDLCFNVNLKGVWNAISALSPHFKEHYKGKIIIISSTGGRGADPEFPAYCASKAAAINLTKSLAVQLGPYNINVNTICPGLIWTDMWEKIERLLGDASQSNRQTGKSTFNSYIEKIPLKRTQTVEDIGHLAVFLASDYAKNITGQSIDIDGGELLT